MSLAGVVHHIVTNNSDHQSTPDNAEASASSQGSGSTSAAHLTTAAGDPSASESGPAVGTTPHIHLVAQPRENQGQSSHNRYSYYKSLPNTPAARTGPPRSLSFATSYSFTNSPTRHNGGHQLEPGDLHSGSYDGAGNSVSRTVSEFRGALEPLPSRDRLSVDRKGKRRENRSVDDGWALNPVRWFHDSPKDERPRSAVPWTPPEQKNIQEDGEDTMGPKTGGKAEEGPQSPRQKFGPPFRRVTDAERHPESSPQHRKGLRRALSLPQAPSDNRGGKARWTRLRSLLPNITNLSQDQNNANLTGSSVITASPSVNITDELITGGLSTLMLRLWFERDEKGRRRVPALFHRLKIRISDSYHPTEEKRTVFRIECEYANGAARWVIYRQLRDFFSLHTHYTVSNVYNRLGDELPEFPLTSIPYLKFLKKEDAQINQASFARLQREALETYLVKLIRAVMFHPSSNRLAGFLEISALSITLAQSGGVQYKGGYLKTHAVNNGGGGFGRKGLGWKVKQESRWAAVRESYLVVVSELGELDVWDVFLFDPEFKIERPKRYYRQGLTNIFHNELAVMGHHIVSPEKDAEDPAAQQQNLRPTEDRYDNDRHSVFGSIKSHVSRIFHLDSDPSRRASGDTRSGARKSQEVDNTDSDSSSSISLPAGARTPMLDPSTNLDPMSGSKKQEKSSEDGGRINGVIKKIKPEADVSKHTFFIVNSQMRLKLSARSERQMLQWITALERSASSSPYTGQNRFDSFAPIRLNVAAQWLVDGRDYFWNLSRAILLARESIYIHDWWLSPELFMRRPNKERYRLDHLLERKAKEGVKIYVILYQEVSNRTTPTDSNYAKQRLMGLHPNVMVQRSPSHFQTGTFYWAHHEKVCVIDQAIAFMGGIDLCFGRWDTPQHVMVDDVEGTDRPEIWPGKDYSNPRLSDFHNLSKPEEDMYDRSKIPRMPWHDVAMQVVGQPARDLARHFVQRWNYLLRIKNHTRVMPFLLPPPEFKPGELTHMGLTGTCEMQICRSAGPWSMGTPAKVEHSIQNAYLKAIQMSEHFVYIENQFFITSTVVNDIKVENKIGDAIVHRIIKAHRDRTPWKCCIVIPLLPGFTFPVDHSDASAIRIILECQNRTLFRGPNSIFSRLRKEGIDPDEYIAVFSLRNWAKLRGDVLTTEQVYIHAKVCVVDDRLAIIGSANINERSLRGDRDSEVAAVIRDTDMIDGTMAGQPFKVGRFAHTLRVRLMREHLGIDVDALDEEDLMASEPVQPEHEQQPWDPEQEQEYGQGDGVIKSRNQHTTVGILAEAGLNNVKQAGLGAGEDISKVTEKTLRKVGLGPHVSDEIAGDAALEKERKDFTPEGNERTGFASSAVPTIEERTVAEKRSQMSQPASTDQPDPKSEEHQPLDKVSNGVDPGDTLGAHKMEGQAPVTNGSNTNNEHGTPSDSKQEKEQEGSSTQDTLRRRRTTKSRNKWTVPIPRPRVDSDGFEDPISDTFWKDTWITSAAYNTEIYRKVFHAVPDDTVTTWKQYKEFVAHHDRLVKPSAGPGEYVTRIPSETGDMPLGAENGASQEPHEGSSEGTKENGSEQQNCHSPHGAGEHPRKPSKSGEPFDKQERDDMESLLKELNGHLVVYPTRFLEDEDIANNFLFNADRLLPIPIYN